MASALFLLSCSMVSTVSTADTQEERRCNHLRPIGHVAIVGGTHGNERMGLIMVDELQRKPPTCSYRLSALVANEEAVVARGTGAGRRYMDTDLNRCFLLKDLERPDVPEASEERRAREINELLGPKSSLTPKTDLIIDLHSTTSNTGVLLCLHPHDKFALQLAAHLISLDPSIRIALWNCEDDVALLPSISRSGITVEVGACAHSIIVFELLEKMRNVVHAAIAYVELHNACVGKSAVEATALEKVAEISLFRRAYTLDYPRSNGQSTVQSAFIHPKLQGVRELQERLKTSSPVFARLDGSEELLGSVVPDMGEDEELYPMFINEAAYVEKNVALVLASRRVETVTYWARHLPVA